MDHRVRETCNFTVLQNLLEIAPHKAKVISLNFYLFSFLLCAYVKI